MELATDYRANQPIQLGVGPVLHPDGAVANKMCALFGRAQARDFIDVAAAFRSGYDRERLLALAAGADPGFDRRMFAGALGEAARLPDSACAPYNVGPEDLAALRKWFADWRAELLAGA